MVAAQYATPETKSAGSDLVDPKIGETVTYYDVEGTAIGSITAESIERGWEEYDSYYDPEEGTEYVAFVITVDSTIARGAIDVERYGFSLQTAMGLNLGPAFVESDAADPALLDDTIGLANGDSETFTVVFQVYTDEPLAHLFWSPEYGVLITVAQLEGE